MHLAQINRLLPQRRLQPRPVDIHRSPIVTRRPSQIHAVKRWLGYATVARGEYSANPRRCRPIWHKPVRMQWHHGS